MKFQGAAVIVLCGLCGLVASQVSTDHVIPWWPKNQVTEVSGSQESTDKDISHENEVNNNWLTDTEDDAEKKEIFFRFVNKLLWDEDAESENDAEGRRFNNFRRRGFMQRPMPQILRRDNNIVGQSYRGMVDACYGLACSLGLQSIADSIARMFF